MCDGRGVLTAGRPAPPPERSRGTKPPVAGLDPAAFDKNIRPQDDLFLHVNGAWLAKTEIPAILAIDGAQVSLTDVLPVV